MKAATAASMATLLAATAAQAQPDDALDAICVAGFETRVARRSDLRGRNLQFSAVLANAGEAATRGPLRVKMVVRENNGGFRRERSFSSTPPYVQLPASRTYSLTRLDFFGRVVAGGNTTPLLVQMPEPVIGQRFTVEIRVWQAFYPVGGDASWCHRRLYYYTYSGRPTVQTGF